MTYSEFISHDGHSLQPLDFDARTGAVLAQCLLTGEQAWVPRNLWRNVYRLDWGALLAEAASPP